MTGGRFFIPPTRKRELHARALWGDADGLENGYYGENGENGRRTGTREEAVTAAEPPPTGQQGGIEAGAEQRGDSDGIAVY